MIIKQTNQIQAESPPEDSAQFGIDPMQVAHIMGVLRSSLYTKRALAVVREYSSNAWDAHISVGKGDLPIKVTIPTRLEPVFVVRDYGPGLSRSDVLRHLTQYGYSTKRSTNLEVGGLGIGFKSGFCVTDQFTVTSWHGGVKAIYTAALDTSNKGIMSLFHEEPCGDETGLEVAVPVDPRLVSEFQSEAERFFPTMSPLPRINIDLPVHKTEEDGSWYRVLETSGDQLWTGVMGCVPYRIDLNHPALEDLRLPNLRGTLSAGFKLPIGSVDFSANREELQYTQRTIDLVRENITRVADNYVARLLASLESSEVSGWTRRLQYHEAVKVIGLSWGQGSVQGGTARIPATAEYTVSHHLQVSPRARIYIHPGLDIDPRSARGWDIPQGSTLVVPRTGVTREAALAALNQNLIGLTLDGAPIEPVEASVYWRRPPGEVIPNIKHRKLIFLLNNIEGYGSERWAVAPEPPDGPHVYVRISHFKNRDFDGQITRVYNIFHCLGGELPPIYGYKVTARKNWNPSEIPEGITFNQWLRDALWKLAGDDLQTYGWVQATPEYESFPEKTLHFWVESLRKDHPHPLAEGARAVLDARAAYKTWDPRKRTGFNMLNRHDLEGFCFQAKEWRSNLNRRYPMLGVHDGNLFRFPKETLQYVLERDFFLEHNPSAAE